MGAVRIGAVRIRCAAKSARLRSQSQSHESDFAGGARSYACTAGTASGSTGSGLPARRISPQMTAPATKIAVAHQKATM